METIVMFLDSPLQSWGGESIGYQYRKTENRPTFSAVLGILCSCLGISFRRDVAKVKELRDNIKIDIITLKKGLLLKEFQTCGTKIKERNKNDWFNKNRIPEGNDKSGKIYKKEYLQDAKFLAILQVDDSLNIQQIIEALKSPKWIPFFGRFCCLPASPILIEKTDNFKESLKSKGYLGGIAYRHVDNIDAEYMVMDYPTCDGTNRYSARGIKEEKWNIEEAF